MRTKQTERAFIHKQYHPLIAGIMEEVLPNSSTSFSFSLICFDNSSTSAVYILLKQRFIFPREGGVW